MTFYHETPEVSVQYQGGEEARATEAGVLFQIRLLDSLVMGSGSDRSRSERVERRCIAQGRLKDDIIRARDPAEHYERNIRCASSRDTDYVVGLSHCFLVARL